MLAFATVGSGFCFSLGRYLRFLVRASCFLAQPLASSRFCSEKPRLTLARERGRGNFLSLTEPSGFAVENHSTPWASGSSAASLAHWSATSLPSIPWWLGHHQISIFTLGSLARRAAMCLLASRAYFCPGPGSSEVIPQMAACASMKMVTAPIVWLLVAATCRALARAAHSASNAS